MSVYVDRGGLGLAMQAWRVPARPGQARLGLAGRGSAWQAEPGAAWQARRGSAGRGEAWRGVAGMA
jgi:hypothetical protein